MSYINPLIAKWKAGEPTIGGWLTVADPSIAEYLANTGLDEVTADQQHSTIGVDDLGVVLPAIEARGAIPLTRVGFNDAYLIGRSLDLGAVGVIIPMVNNAAEAAAAVSAFRYPPRGIAPPAPSARPTTWAAAPRELEAAACIVMVETLDGLRNVDQIAATPGVDCIYIGPGDLALGLGLDWDDTTWNPTQAKSHDDAIRTIHAAAKKRGIATGIHAGNGAACGEVHRDGPADADRRDRPGRHRRPRARGSREGAGRDAGGRPREGHGPRRRRLGALRPARDAIMSAFTLGLAALTYSATWPAALATARLADGLGYDQLFTADHLYATGGDPYQPFFEGWTTLAAWAQATSNVVLGLLVGANTFRNPGVVAKMAATIDHVSDGRAILGLGAPGNVEENRAHGIDPGQSLGQRIDWLEESLTIVTGLLAGGEVTQDSEKYQFDRVRHAPLPIRRPIPVMIGAYGEKKGLRIVAKHATLWQIWVNMDDAGRVPAARRRAPPPLRRGRAATSARSSASSAPR